MMYTHNYKYKDAITKKKENEKGFALMNMYTHIASAYIYISVYNISFIKSVHTYVCVYQYAIRECVYLREKKERERELTDRRG